MACPKTLEILQILECKLYPDLNKIILSYFNFIPPTPEELCILVIKMWEEDVYHIIRFKSALNIYGVCESLQIYPNDEIKLKYKYLNLSDQPVGRIFTININEYNELLETD